MNTPPHLQASGDIRPFRFVTIDGNMTGGEANANSRIAGISHGQSNRAQLGGYSTTVLAAEAGEAIPMYGDGEECRIELGDTVTAGDYLKSDADGKGVAIASSGTTLQEVGFQASEGGVAGDIIRGQCLIQQVRPAVS